MRGDCLTCVRLGRCEETDQEKVINSYTCIFFEAVDEGVYLARLEFMRRYGAIAAIQIMLTKPEEGEPDGGK